MFMKVWWVICCLMHIACISIVSCTFYFLIDKVLNSCENLKIHQNLNACFENGNISMLTNSIFIHVYSLSLNNIISLNVVNSIANMYFKLQNQNIHCALFG